MHSNCCLAGFQEVGIGYPGFLSALSMAKDIDILLPVVRRESRSNWQEAIRNNEYLLLFANGVIR